MATRIRGSERHRGSVNTPLPRELAVQVLDAAGKPAKDNWVAFIARPPEAIEFAGAQLYATVKTDEKGIASVRITPRLVGQHRIVAEASDGLGSADFTIEVTDGDGTEVRSMGDDILVINGGGTRPPTHIQMWPIAAMVIAALLVGGLLLWRLGEARQPTVTTVVQPQPAGPTSAELAGVEADIKKHVDSKIQVVEEGLEQKADVAAVRQAFDWQDRDTVETFRRVLGDTEPQHVDDLVP